MHSFPWENFGQTELKTPRSFRLQKVDYLKMTVRLIFEEKRKFCFVLQLFFFQSHWATLYTRHLCLMRILESLTYFRHAFSLNFSLLNKCGHSASHSSLWYSSTVCICVVCVVLHVPNRNYVSSSVLFLQTSRFSQHIVSWPAALYTSWQYILPSFDFYTWKLNCIVFGRKKKIRVSLSRFKW